MALVEDFADYTRWRSDVSAAVQQLRGWLTENDLSDAQADFRLQQVLDRLKEEKMVVAFVAEFSRGKSELINAIFFAHYGSRVLPSSAGRTTMCPTELAWDHGATPGIRLLPIETRSRPESVAELRRAPAEWVFEPFNIDDAESLQKAFMRVADTKLVSRDMAENLGFPIDDTGRDGTKPDANGQVEVACWRHAIIQFPHPLLEQGLIIVDTPGLNAIGSEPELTLSMIPSAHAVLYLLAADTGVTHSDLQVWEKYVAPSHNQRGARMVVLNKIDGLWDGMRSRDAIDAEINKQIHTVAETLSVPTEQIYPVSAQKALFAKAHKDEKLLQRSRITELETALSEKMLPTRRSLTRDTALGETGEIVRRTDELLATRAKNLDEQCKEMSDLRGKNQSVIEYMMRKVRSERDEFETGLQKYHAVRSVFTSLSNKLYSHIGVEIVRTETRRTRDKMSDANFSRGLREAMLQFFDNLRRSLRRSSDEIQEITRMLDAMYKRFSVEHGLKLMPPESFSTLRYEREISRLERAFEEQLNTMSAMVTQSKTKVTERFFDTIAIEARRTFEVANRDVEQWLRAVMSPLETQVREYQLQLKRRLESVKRVHEATGTLEERLEELDQAKTVLDRQRQEVAAMRAVIEQALGGSLAALPESQNAAA